jgi:hypothetical protein
MVGGDEDRTAFALPLTLQPFAGPYPVTLITANHASQTREGAHADAHTSSIETYSMVSERDCNAYGIVIDRNGYRLVTQRHLFLPGKARTFDSEEAEIFPGNIRITFT